MDILDTRDLQTRLEELEDVINDYMEENNLDSGELVDESLAFEDEEDYEELTELRDLAYEIPEWIHGEALINEDDWEEYVEEMLKDIGDLPSDIPWYIEIDWERTANNIKADYSECEYQGSTYYYRCV